MRQGTVAKTGKVINSELLYRVGYATNYELDKNADSVKFWNGLLKGVGKLANTYAINGLKRRQDLEENSNKVMSQSNIDFGDKKEALDPKIKPLIDKWRADITDANKVLAWYPVGSKKYKEAQKKKEGSFKALQNMAKGWESLNTRAQDARTRVMDGDYNKGDLNEEYDNLTLFGSGEIYEHLAVDDEGNWYVERETEVGTGEYDVSDEAYARFASELSAEGVEDANIPSKKDWAANQAFGKAEIMKIESDHTLLRDMKIAGKSSDSAQILATKYVDLARKDGYKKNGLWNDSNLAYYKNELKASIQDPQLTSASIKHFVFAGYANDLSDTTSEESSIAYQLAINAGYTPDFPDNFYGFIEMLKKADYSPGSTMRKAVIEQMWDGAVQTNKNFHQEWINDNPGNVPPGTFKTRNVEVRPRNIDGEYFAKETTTNKSMIEFSDNLAELKADKKGSVFSGEYVNKFGFNFGHDPKKGFYEVDITNEEFGLWPIKGARYFKTQEDLFQHYNIPTDYIGVSGGNVAELD